MFQVLKVETNKTCIKQYVLGKCLKSIISI